MVEIEELVAGDGRESGVGDWAQVYVRERWKNYCSVLSSEGWLSIRPHSRREMCALISSMSERRNVFRGSRRQLRVKATDQCQQ